MIISWWLLHRLSLALVLATLALVGLQLSFDFLQALEQAERVGLNTSLQALLLNIPSRVNDYYAYAWLTAVLVVVGEMSKSGILTVLKISGLSDARLSLLVLAPVLALSLAWVGFYESYGLGMRAQAEALGGSSSSASVQSLWFEEGERFVHIGSSDGQGLNLVVIADVDWSSASLRQALVAEGASYDRARQSWDLQTVQQYQLQASGALTRSSQASVPWDFPLPADILLNLANDPQLVKLMDLWLLDSYFAKVNSGANAFSLELWRRLLLPLSVATLVFMALGFVNSFARSASLGARVFFALGIGIVVESLNKLLGALFIQLLWPAVYALALTMALNLSLGWYFWRRSYS